MYKVEISAISIHCPLMKTNIYNTYPPVDRHPVDATDWLKTAAILLVCVDHIGLFFIENDVWWRVAGRMAAPMFFFLIGYSRRTSAPWTWFAIGTGLTVLESWGEEWVWAPLNILVSFAVFRFCRPAIQQFASGSGPLFALLLLGLAASQPVTGTMFEYGATGWLWALLGLCQREYVDSGEAEWRYKRVATALIVLPVYFWFERIDLEFTAIPATVFAAGVVVMCAWLLTFRRGPSPVQPPFPATSALHFLGRYTLELYTLQLAVSELIAIFELVG